MVRNVLSPRARVKFLGQAAATRQARQSRKSAHRLLSMQHLTASRALAPAFDQRQPDRLNRLPTPAARGSSAVAPGPIHPDP